MTKAAIIIENSYATIAVGGKVFTTTRLNPGQYVRIDDGNQYPQLCVAATTRGSTIEYVNPESLAYACRATLYKTRRGFDAAVSRQQSAN